MEGDMMISTNCKTKIKGYLEGFIQGLIDEFKPQSNVNPKELRPMRKDSKEGDIKPFHEAIIPDGILRITEFERSFSTKLGTTFEEVARLIALENHKDAQRQYRIEGKISSPAIKKIEKIRNAINSKGFTGDYKRYVGEVVKASSKEGELRHCIADLYILKHNGEELFIEIKSPKPNKGQCLEATERLLEFHAIKRKTPPAVQTYYATAYNPYGIEKSTYNHSFTLNYMDIDQEVLIGKEFWKIVGNNPNTYHDVLELYREVGKERGPHMIDKLALGY
jgi:hypothetical protein